MRSIPFYRSLDNWLSELPEVEILALKIETENLFNNEGVNYSQISDYAIAYLLIKTGYMVKHAIFPKHAKLYSEISESCYHQLLLRFKSKNSIFFDKILEHIEEVECISIL